MVSPRELVAHLPEGGVEWTSTQPPATLLAARPKAAAPPLATCPLSEQLHTIHGMLEQALQPKCIEVEVPVVKAAPCLPARCRSRLVRSRRSA